jgi:hypothetical protein
VRYPWSRGKARGWSGRAGTMQDGGSVTQSVTHRAACTIR